MRITESIGEDEAIELRHIGLFDWFERELTERYFPERSDGQAPRKPVRSPPKG